MCSVYGMLVHADCSADERAKAVENFGFLASQSIERGRDGQGYSLIARDQFITNRYFDDDPAHIPILFHELHPEDLLKGAFAGLGNCRAEPTTEYVEAKHLLDQQPYTLGSWTIVHNGTISNDKDLRTDEYKTKIDSAAIVELLDKLTCAQAKRDCVSKNPDDWVLTPDKLWTIFGDMLRVIEGSYAILAVHQGFPDLMFAACNYRPLYLAYDNGVHYFASSPAFFPGDLSPKPIQPYTATMVSSNDQVMGRARGMLPRHTGKQTKALVVLSGGLDSTVALAKCLLHYGTVTALHFSYGARPAGKELAAVEAICEHYNIGLVKLPLGNISTYNSDTSKLLDPGSTISGGEAGAEFAHEWVPARNLLMLATATAYAEAHGYEIIALGNNMEEAGAYPDNEPELYQRFNGLLPFAIGANKQLQVIQPVGNLMKHEIVQQGLAIAAPLHLTWSCYKSGALHCGKCGPCFMRKQAFAINTEAEVIQYQTDGDTPVDTYATFPTSGKAYRTKVHRFDIPQGTVVYKARFCDYGLANDDTRATGIEHVTVTKNPDGSAPGFTIPVNELHEIEQLKPE